MSCYRFTSLFILSALITACGGESSTSTSSFASFSVSDAPVDTATEVVIAFEKLEFIPEEGDPFFIHVDIDDNGNNYQHVDLLKYQGEESTLIITEKALPIGEYKNLIIHTTSGNLNYVEDNGIHALKIPSNKLKLGGFTVTKADVQQFTIEFDLRQSLVQRGNTNTNNGYNLKPHGVTVIDNSAATSLKGTVDLALLSSVESCIDNESYIYLYQNHYSLDTRLIDLMDTLDPDYVNVVLPSLYATPYTSTQVNPITGNYVFGFIPEGIYTIAFTCNGVEDNPVQFDNILIANPIEQRFNIELEPNVEKTFNFVEVKNE